MRRWKTAAALKRRHFSSRCGGNLPGGPGDDLSDWLEAEAEVFEMEAQEIMKQRALNPAVP